MKVFHTFWKLKIITQGRFGAFHWNNGPMYQMLCGNENSEWNFKADSNFSRYAVIMLPSSRSRSMNDVRYLASTLSTSCHTCLFKTEWLRELYASQRAQCGPWSRTLSYPLNSGQKLQKPMPICETEQPQVLQSMEISWLQRRHSLASNPRLITYGFEDANTTHTLIGSAWLKAIGKRRGLLPGIGSANVGR